MNFVIFNPLEEYQTKFKSQHADHVKAFFEELVKQSGVDPELNRETVRQLNESRENLEKWRRKLNWLRFFRVLMCITLILIPLVILKMTPKIRALREEISKADEKAKELLAEANRQMAPLNALFTDKDSLSLVEKTLPGLDFHDHFSAKHAENMMLNFDFEGDISPNATCLDLLAGEYNENPFLFERDRVHTMGTETYHGYKTIYWTETYRDSDGRLRTRNRSETLHATVVKPKPFYHSRLTLRYGAQGGPELSFSRDAGHLNEKSDRALERHIKKGEKELKKKSDRAVKENDNFVSMSNSEFEVLFDALDRTDEVQFRTLFTPLAQTNLVALIRSDEGFGDDFHFTKVRRMNHLFSEHSQGRNLFPRAVEYPSYAYDQIAANFTEKNLAFFKELYFDFAPLWSIPMYQERPVHSLKPLPPLSKQFAPQQCEALVNAAPAGALTHPLTKTPAIFKTAFLRTTAEGDENRVTAFSYDIEKRIEYVMVHGGDGRWHSVPVPWDEYLPLEEESTVTIKQSDTPLPSALAASRGLSIYRTDFEN